MRWGRLEAQLVVDQLGLRGVAREAGAKDGFDVVVQITAGQQFLDQETHAAGGVEMVHVGDAVGIDAGEQRHGVRQVRHVLPVDLQAGGRGDGDEVDGVVGRAAGGVEADEAV